MTGRSLVSVLAFVFVMSASGSLAQEARNGHPIVLAQGGAHSDPQAVPEQPSEDEPKLTPEDKMRRRFPQAVKVGDLIGLPVLDFDDSTIGFVRHVVRTPEGKIQLIVNHGRLFGWGGRLVPVPIEVVAILARQIAALDMEREEFSTAPTWSASNTQPIGPDEMIKIAITRR